MDDLTLETDKGPVTFRTIKNARGGVTVVLNDDGTIRQPTLMEACVLKRHRNDGGKARQRSWARGVAASRF